MIKAKFAAAVLCIVLAITGMLQEIRWLTISALVLWGLSLAYFGLGDRSKSSMSEEEIKRIEKEFENE